MLGILAGESFQFRIVICGKLDNVRWENLQCFQGRSHLILKNKYIYALAVSRVVLSSWGEIVEGTLLVSSFVERSIFFSDSQKGRTWILEGSDKSLHRAIWEGTALTRNYECCPQDLAKFSTFKNCCSYGGGKSHLAESPSPIWSRSLMVVLAVSSAACSLLRYHSANADFSCVHIKYIG